jgi:integrase/recombinase XerD
MKRDVKNEFYTYLRVERGLSANTLEAYRRDLERLERWASARLGKSVPSLSRADILEYIQVLRQDGLESKSISRAMVTVRNFFKFLILDGIVKHDPTVNVESPKAWQTLPKFLTLEEVDLILEQPDTTTDGGVRDRAMLELLYAT